MQIRPATTADIRAVAALYSKIHTEDECGRATVGWVRGVYPTEATAQEALRRGDLFVGEENGKVVATAIINQLQPEAYVSGDWKEKVPANEVMVLHTLAVDPAVSGRGIGRQFIDFFETYAAGKGCHELRIDTQIINLRARRLYQHLGYQEVDVVPCTFNGIKGVQLVLMEKHLSVR